MRRAKREKKWSVAGTEYRVAIPAWACTQCDEVVLDGPSLVRAELTVAAELAKKGPIGPETFRFMRRAIATRAAEIARLLDVSPETVSHWENGRNAPPRAAWMLVSGLVLDAAAGETSTRERLESAAVARRKRAARVALTLLSVAGFAAGIVKSRR